MSTAADSRLAVVERLVNEADIAGLVAEDLDELVRELASSIAADVNNGGLEDQIAYLVVGLGAQPAERQIDELMKAHTNQTEQGE